MFDLHSHILPGIDDGPATVEAALEMADVASRTGTAVMLATPHRKDVTEGSSVHHVRELLADLNRRIGERRADLEVVLGMENHLDADLPDEVSRNRALPINGSRYILVEMPFFGRPHHTSRGCCTRFKSRGECRSWRTLSGSRRSRQTRTC